MHLVLLTAGLVYAAVLLRLAGGLRHARQRFDAARASGETTDLPPASIVIAARNEAVSLPALLTALDAQEYPAGRLEIVVVDDGSTDATPQILAEHVTARHSFRHLRIETDPSAGSPKKAALAAGIAATGSAVLLLTDADTVPPPGWAGGLGAALGGGCSVVAGFSPAADRPGLLGRTTRLWDLGTAVLAGGFIGLGETVHLTGRSWGFTRQLYERAGGYAGLEQALSGDDTLLAQKLARHAPPSQWGFTLDPDLQVPTRPFSGWRAFAASQLRHVATGTRFSPRALGIAGAGFVIFALLWIALVSLPLSPWGASSAVAVMLKLLGDTTALAVGAHAAGQKNIIAPAPLFSLMHLLVFPLLQVAGVFMPFRWKGRRGR